MPERFKVVFTVQGAIQVLGFTFTNVSDLEWRITTADVLYLCGSRASCYRAAWNADVV